MRKGRGARVPYIKRNPGNKKKKSHQDSVQQPVKNQPRGQTEETRARNEVIKKGEGSGQ